MRLIEAISLGRQAAFHGSPAAGFAPLRTALTESGGDVAEPEVAEATLILGTCLGAGGLFGSALDAIGALFRANTSQSAAAHCLAGSIYRQIGDFHAAAAHDEASLESTGSVRCEALLGCAADSVGLGEVEAAATYLAAGHELWQPSWWREGIRLAWVTAEVGLLGGDPGQTLPGLRAALTTAQLHRAPRHVAKTQLFLGVVLRTAAPEDADADEESTHLLAAAAAGAEQLGAWPLVWAIGSVRREWLHETGEQATARQAAIAAARAAAIIAADLPTGLREAWLARPDVQIPEP